MTITTTLNKIREHAPCVDGWSKLLKHLGKTRADDEPLSLLTVLESNGLDDTLWCLRAVSGYDREFRLYAVWCARLVVHLMTDQRSLVALDVAERYANGQATGEELAAAASGAVAAAAVTWNGGAAAESVASIAAADAARDIAWDAAWDAACDAAGALTRDDVGDTEWDTGEAIVRDVAWDAARAAQVTELIRLLEEGHAYRR